MCTSLVFITFKCRKLLLTRYNYTSTLTRYTKIRMNVTKNQNKTVIAFTKYDPIWMQINCVCFYLKH